MTRDELTRALVQGFHDEPTPGHAATGDPMQCWQCRAVVDAAERVQLSALTLVSTEYAVHGNTVYPDGIECADADDALHNADGGGGVAVERSTYVTPWQPL